jgi:predicted lipid-binding transport protein (Tim44 family)
MNKALPILAVVLALGMTFAHDVEAKRLGGGRSSGMQRQATTAPASPHTPSGTPAQQAAPAAGTAATAGAPGAAAAATPKRNWMGPVAGLAAGLGLAALASHLGFGEALANFMMMGLLVMAALMVIGFVMRKRAMGQTPAVAGAGGPMGGTHRETARHAGDGTPAERGSMIGSRIGGAPAGTASMGVQPAGIPADFDRTGFEWNAKSQFVALQAANDARDMDRLRDYLTPEMFDTVRADIAERGDAPQHTEVFGLQAQLVSVVEDDGRYVASVRFTGSVRDQRGADIEDLDETWHLTKPRAGAGGWVIAGIQQNGS